MDKIKVWPVHGQTEIRCRRRPCGRKRTDPKVASCLWAASPSAPARSVGFPRGGRATPQPETMQTRKEAERRDCVWSQHL